MTLLHDLRVKTGAPLQRHSSPYLPKHASLVRLREVQNRIFTLIFERESIICPGGLYRVTEITAGNIFPINLDLCSPSSICPNSHTPIARLWRWPPASSIVSLPADPEIIFSVIERVAVPMIDYKPFRASSQKSVHQNSSREITNPNPAAGINQSGPVRSRRPFPLREEGQVSLINQCK